MKSVFKRILRILIISFLTCFFAAIILMISNKVLGVEGVGIIYYLLLSGLCFVMLSMGLIFANAENIFKRKSPKKVNKNIDEKAKTRPKTIQRKTRRRKIS